MASHSRLVKMLIITETDFNNRNSNTAELKQYSSHNNYSHNNFQNWTPKPNTVSIHNSFSFSFTKKYIKFCCSLIWLTIQMAKLTLSATPLAQRWIYPKLYLEINFPSFGPQCLWNQAITIIEVMNPAQIASPDPKELILKGYTILAPT